MTFASVAVDHCDDPLVIRAVCCAAVRTLYCASEAAWFGLLHGRIG